jgi:plastocyanin
MRIFSKAPWILAGLAALLVLLVPLPARSQAPGNVTYEIDASRFEYLPAEIRVNPGDQVTLKLTSHDVVHGLSIDGYGVQMTADPGKTASLSFIADKPGMFRFRCTVTCGNLHPFMIGKIYVGQNTLLWRGAALVGLLMVMGLWKLWK